MVSSLQPPGNRVDSYVLPILRVTQTRPTTSRVLGVSGTGFLLADGSGSVSLPVMSSRILRRPSASVNTLRSRSVRRQAHDQRSSRWRSSNGTRPKMSRSSAC